MKTTLKNIALKLGFDIRRYNLCDRKVVSLYPNNACNGNVLLSYIIDPFLLKDGVPIPSGHTHYWESFQIAKTFLDMGYCVDVVHYTNNIFTPNKYYSFFVGARTNFQRITQLLNKDCVKIVHLDMAHWVFNNYAAYKRSLSLQQRKGISIRSTKIQEINWAIENADFATVLGNTFTINTYNFANKPIFHLSVPTNNVYPYPQQKDYEACRNHFLWFGSG
ncbi:MAG: glycosyltransferase family 1 protein, partial [Thermodesulfobacteriota bacterium]